MRKKKSKIQTRKKIPKGEIFPKVGEKGYSLKFVDCHQIYSSLNQHMSHGPIFLYQNAFDAYSVT